MSTLPLASTLSAGCQSVEGKKRDGVGGVAAAAAAVLSIFYVLITALKLLFNASRLFFWFHLEI